MSARMHTLAQAFRARLRREIPSAGDVDVTCVMVPGFGLAVQVDAMAPWRYSTAALADVALGPGARLLSEAGEKLWADLGRLGTSVAGHELSFALIHNPDSLEAARVEHRAAA